MASVKKNFIYSTILTVSNYLFPLITYPYVSRVLGVNNIGICNYVDSMINYFILFSMMGMSVIGIREIASANTSKKEVSSSFFSLIYLNGVTTLIALIGLLVCMYTLPLFVQYRDMFYIGVVKLIGNFLLIDWFYKGIEDFKYITKRTIIVKFAYVISVFLFINEQGDYKIFFLLNTLMLAVNAVFNVGFVRKFVTLKDVKLKVRKTIKPYFIMGLYAFLTSMYTSFNVFYLGYTTDTVQVGYYTTATKIYGLILAFYAAFTGVMLPRMSSLLSENRMEEFKGYIKKSTDFLFLVIFPIICFSIVYAKEIIMIVSGPGYEGAIIPFQLTMILLFLVGYDQIQIIQVLMPMKDDKAVLTNSTLGAIVGIAANVLLVKHLQSIGSAIVLVVCEIALLISSQYFIRKHVDIRFPFKLFTKSVVAHIPLGVILYIVEYSTNNLLFSVSLGLTIVFIYETLLYSIILKNQIFNNLTNQVKNKIKWNI